MAHDGIPVNVIDVPEVEATAVPDVITLLAIELITAPVIVGLVSVGDVCNTGLPAPVGLTSCVAPTVC